MAENSHDTSSALRLAEQAAEGDTEAFALLFGRYRQQLHRFLALRIDPRLRRRVDPSDVLQETQIAAHRRLGDFLQRREVPIRVWLRSLALERWLNLREKHLQAARRSIDREMHLPRHSSRLLSRTLIDQGLSPSEIVSQRESEKRLINAIEALPDIDREIVLMRALESLSFVEIAQILDISHAAARQRFGRTLIALRDIINQ